MSAPAILRLGSVKDVSRFKQHLQSLNLNLPCDEHLIAGSESPLQAPLVVGSLKIGNRIAVQPMEGWDGTADGNPTESTMRRWQRFGLSGGKLIWGGEAVAVSNDGRANPNQLVAAPHTYDGLARLREGLICEHRRATGSDDGLVIGLQLTHSGRYSRPKSQNSGEPHILYHHPLLDRRLRIPTDYPLLTDGEVRAIIDAFQRAALMASKLGFDFVDIKHCHGYLGHEFLSAYTRDGDYGGSFENRTRFLREVVEGIRSEAPKLHIGVRLSVFDSVPFVADPHRSSPGREGEGIPEGDESLIPYHWGFGLNPNLPTQPDLTEPIMFLSLLQQLNIKLVNLTAGSPYYNPHIQRPALYPPSDGYLTPEDPIVGVARQIDITHQIKQRFPNLVFVGSAYSYLQDFLPNVAQAILRNGWVDLVGIGRVVLSYPEFLWHASTGHKVDHRKVCRTFSDCTTAPRKGLPSGCYPLDSYYKASEFAKRLNSVKKESAALNACVKEAAHSSETE